MKIYGTIKKTILIITNLKKRLTKETVRKLLIIRSSYKDEDQSPKQIYNSLNISRAKYYRYIKILEQYTNDEIKQMQIK